MSRVSRLRLLYQQAYIDREVDWEDLKTGARVKGMLPDDQVPPLGTLSGWKSRYQWDAKRAELTEIVAAMPPLDVQAELVQYGGMKKLPTLADRLQQIAPEQLRESITASLADDLQLSNARTIALYDARIHQLVSRLGTTESSQIWSEVKEEVEQLRSALATGSREDIQLSVKRLLLLTQRGDRDDQNWQQIGLWCEKRSYIVKQEVERLKFGQNYLTVEEAMTIATEKMTKILALVKRYGSDELIAAIRDELSSSGDNACYRTS